jgi:hypothetical protein
LDLKTQTDVCTAKLNLRELGLPDVKLKPEWILKVETSQPESENSGHMGLEEIYDQMGDPPDYRSQDKAGILHSNITCQRTLLAH